MTWMMQLHEFALQLLWLKFHCGAGLAGKDVLSQELSRASWVGTRSERAGSMMGSSATVHRLLAPGARIFRTSTFEGSVGLAPQWVIIILILSSWTFPVRPSFRF
jgi:hypothetical protein